MMRRPEIAQNQIGEHGLIGNMHTAALVGWNGTIDWLCYPHFDSPSIFASILDTRRGGAYVLRPENEASSRHTQFYWSGTNVLVTRFWSRESTVDVLDLMPVDPGRTMRHRHGLLRHVTCLRGEANMQLWCEPRFQYGLEAAQASASATGVRMDGPDTSIDLASEQPLDVEEGAASASFRLRRGESQTFVLEAAPRDAHAEPLSEREARAEIERTASYWRRWIDSCTYRGRWREQVERSALVLKLLTFAPTGAIVAAPTCSLPSDIGGERNWDYRYTWIRDASLVVLIMMRLGFHREAAEFLAWVRDRCAEGPDLRPLYRNDGGLLEGERLMEHLSGYMGSRPVRVGNEASVQLQLDVYGPLIDAIYLFNEHGTPIDRNMWEHVRSMIDWLCDNWHHPDQGLWEVRSEPRHFTFSKVATWVAMDRAIRLAQRLGFPADMDRWHTVRDAVGDWVYQNAWNDEVNAFVQVPGEPQLDASLLLMPILFFASPMDERMQATVRAIHDRLGPDGLVRRYQRNVVDGLSGSDGAFAPCCFWLVEAYTRQGKLSRARRLLEMLLAQSNHLDLYAEQFTTDGRLLGNFPQAFTHLAMISATVNLDRALDHEEGRSEWTPATAWRI